MVSEPNGQIRRIVFFVFGCFCLLTATATPVCSSSTAAKIELILDVSGSMWGRLPNGQTKIDAAKTAVRQLVNQLPDHTILAYRAYGHQSHRDKKDCKDTELLVNFDTAKGNRAAIINRTNGLSPKGYTPITYALEKAASDFKSSTAKQHTIILVSDGKETCAGDPCATAATLAAGNITELVVHTVGFGVDTATQGQLECIARVSGGQYYAAGSTQELVDRLQQAVSAARTISVKTDGPGWLEIKGADLSGHEVTTADSGVSMGRLSHVKASMELPAGIYHVTIGKAAWKSVQIRTGETTTLVPGWLKVENAWIKGHSVLDAETGEAHGNLSTTRRSIALIPGHYHVMFGNAAWPVRIRSGVQTHLRPGTITVENAGVQFIAVLDKDKQKLGMVSSSQRWMPLPPGDYYLQLKSGPLAFSLQAGEDVTVQQ